MNRKSRHLIAACILMAASLWASIQPAMEPPPYYKNVTFTFQVTYKNQPDSKPPEMMSSDDFIVRAGTPQQQSFQQFYSINGKVTRQNTVSTTYPFYLTPKRTGTLTLPTCVVYQDGKKKTLPSQTIDVQRPNTNDIMTLTMTADKKICALGQPVRLSFIWKIRLPSQRYASQGPIRALNISIPALTLPNLDAEPVSIPGKHYNLPVNGQTEVDAQVQSYGSILSFAFDYTIIPRKAGILELPPATIACQVIDGSRRRRSNHMDPFFFASSYEATYTRAAAESAPLTLVVKEPPAANRPDSYAGLAEPCTVTTSADKTDVYVGDPIQLTITVKGPQFPKSVILPKLQSNQDFAKTFRVFDNDEPGTVNRDGSVTFLRTIRASTTEITRIPPVRLSWFDAKTETYRTAQSKPIPITVKPTQVATSITQTSSPATEEKIEVTSADQGPRPNVPPQECLENQHEVGGHPLLTTEGLILLIMPGLALLVLAVRQAVSHSRQNASKHLSKSAAARALRALKEAARHEAPAQYVISALQEYLADKTQRPRDSLTLTDMELYLEQVKAPQDMREHMRTIIGQCEAAVYASTALDNPTETIETLQTLIQQLDRL